VKRKIVFIKIVIGLIGGALCLFPARAYPSLPVEDISECDCNQSGRGECKQYLSKLIEAVENCDLEGIRGIATSDQAALYPCLKDAAYEAECYYFKKCIQPTLEKSASSCELEEILKAEEQVKASFTECIDYRLMKEIVSKYKCVDFAAGCFNEFIQQALTSCDFDRLKEVEQTVLLESLRDCPNYKRLKILIKEAKSTYFYDCLKPELEQAQQDCNIERFSDLETFIAENMQGCFDYNKIRQQVFQIKCQHPEECFQTALENSLSACDLPALLRLKTTDWGYGVCPDVDRGEIINLFKVAEKRYMDSCGPDVLDEFAGSCKLYELAKWERDVKAFPEAGKFMKETREKRCSLIANCLKRDLQAALYNCDFGRIPKFESWLEAKPLKICSSQVAELKEFINAQKETYLGRCVPQELEIARSVCDIGRIMELEGFINSGVFDKFNINAIQELLDQSRDSYIEDCLERDFQHAVQDCNPEGLGALIDKLEPLLSQNVSRYRQLRQQIQEWNCQFMESCVSEEIERAIAQADMDHLNFIEGFLEQRLKHCEQYSAYKSRIKQAQNTISSSLP
jgi:hypothetical protein